MAEQQSHSIGMFVATVIAAIIGALGSVGAAYVGLLKPTERQIDNSDRFITLARESESYKAQVQDLTRQLRAAQSTSAQARSEEEKRLAGEISELRTRNQELVQRIQSLLSEVDVLSKRLADTKSPGTQPLSASTGGGPTLGPQQASETLARPQIDLKTLVGRWVGLAECSRGDRPTSIDVVSASASELKVKYSDSLNNTVEDAFLILLSSASGKATFAFRTKDDRFISLKNGDHLILDGSGLLVSPSDASKQCKLALSKS